VRSETLISIAPLPGETPVVTETLVLSLFPGIGLLDMAFEEAGFSVVRGPDVIWGGDIRRFHVPAGHFAGVIGGPPCQSFSSLAALNRSMGREIRFGNLIPEFERVVMEAQPEWFVMEQVRRAPLPVVEGYGVHEQILNNRWLGDAQHRIRRISFGTRDGRRLPVQQTALEALDVERAVTSTSGGRRAFPHATDPRRGKQGKGADALLKTRTVAECAVVQGLPADFLSDSPLTDAGKRKAIANGVPLPMGRAIAKAVRAAMYPDSQAGAA
jgi:DNA (cytosine-5)-methyltransferase 1